MACPADHEGLASPFGHELRPGRLWPSRLNEVSEPADLVDFHLGRLLAQLAPARLEPADQLLAAGDGQGGCAVVDDRCLLPCQRDATEPGDQWFPAGALDADLEAG